MQISDIATAIPETRSELAIPIKVEDQVYGVLDVQSNQVDAFHSMDQMVLGALADNIAIAIENVTLYTQLEKRVEQINTVCAGQQDDRLDPGSGCPAE